MFSGGITHATFLAMLLATHKLDEVLAKLTAETLGRDVQEVVIYGEGYGGKCQGLSRVYGPTNFVAFEVQRGGYWLDVERAAEFVTRLGLPFVHFERGPVTQEWLTQQRDRPSEQARRNGLWDGNPETGKSFHREGVVIRPLLEWADPSGGRVMVKFRQPESDEKKTPKSLDEGGNLSQETAEKIAEEYSTATRLEHVLSAMISRGEAGEVDGLRGLTIKDTGKVCKAFVEDIAVEAARDDGVEWSDAIGKSVSRKACALWKARLRMHPIANPIEGR